MRYLCFHPCLLTTSLAFGVLDYYTWPQPPAGRDNNVMSNYEIKKQHYVIKSCEGIKCFVPSDS